MSKLIDIPKIINYVYWITPNSRGINFHNYLCILSAAWRWESKIKIYTNDAITLKSYPWIGRLITDLNSTNNELIEIIELPTEGLLAQSIFGLRDISNLHPAHISDFIRLWILETHGGTYLDLDILVTSGITSDRDDISKCYIPREVDTEDCLCNCLISAPPGHEFIRTWRGEMVLKFDPEIAVPGTENYAFYSVVLPQKILNSNKFDKSVVILPTDKYQPFGMTYPDTQKLFFLDHSIIKPRLHTQFYRTVHLWETRNWPILKNLDKEYFKNSSAFYAVEGKSILSNFGVI